VIFNGIVSHTSLKFGATAPYCSDVFDSTLGYPGEGPRRNRRGKGGGRSTNATQLGKATFIIRGTPFSISQTSSGNGALGSNGAETNISATGTQAYYLDPYSFGGRFYQLASGWDEYKIHWISFRYAPYDSGSGVVSIPAGSATTSPGYANRPFAIAYNPDPAYVLGNYAAFLSAGGWAANTSRGFSLRIKPQPISPWLMTTTTVSSPSVIDLRMSAFGNLNARFADTSSTNGFTYGILVSTLKVSFRSAEAFSNSVGGKRREPNPWAGVLRPSAEDTVLPAKEMVKSRSTRTEEKEPHDATCAAGSDSPVLVTSLDVKRLSSALTVSLASPPTSTKKEGDDKC